LRTLHPDCGANASANAFAVDVAVDVAFELAVYRSMPSVSLLHRMRGLRRRPQLRLGG